jgi:hypothetical protein
MVIRERSSDVQRERDRKNICTERGEEFFYFIFMNKQMLGKHCSIPREQNFRKVVVDGFL